MKKIIAHIKIFTLLIGLIFSTGLYGQFAIDAVATDGVSCNVGEGRINVYTSGGGVDFYYFLHDRNPLLPGAVLVAQILNSSEDTASFGDISAGTYYLTAYNDGTGTSLGQNVTLAAGSVQTEALTVNAIQIISGPSCYDSEDAVLGADVSGGNPPYTYLWAGGNAAGQTTQQATGLGQNIYSVTVNDNNNCGPGTSNNPATIFYIRGVQDGGTIPEDVDGGAIGSDQNVCAGIAAADLTNVTSPSGGNGVYTYDWEYQDNCAGAWNSLGINNLVYSPGVIPNTRCYRRVTTNVCGVVYSDTVTITVNPLPVPALAGSITSCVGNSEVYTTDPGMSGYTWVVSAGGTVTSGGGASNNTVTVTWNTSGAQSVSINYNDANACSAVAPTTVNVAVNPPATPALAGPNSVCEGSTGNIYTTDAGMTNYAWTISAGGTVTSGGGVNDNTVTITWDTPGAQTVSVDYTNGNGCNATTPTLYNITVNPSPVPALAGPNDVCEASVGNVYTTDVGMTNYSWVVSAGGTITAGGGVNDNTVTITWNTAGAQTVSIDYTDATGCTAVAPTVYNVTVNALPTPALAGPNTVCQASTGNVYTTDAGMTNYTWVVSAGGTITAGGGVNDNTVTITWNTAGARTVSVNYDNANGCSAAAPTVYNVIVSGLPTPSLGGPNSVCIGSTGNVYTTDAGMTNYSWVVSAGGTVTAGGGVNDNTVTVTWNTAGAGTVSVNYDNASGCSAIAPSSYNITVNNLPTPSLAGPNSVCETSLGNVYTTDVGMTNYSWVVSAGGTITAGGGVNDNTVTVTWNTAGARTVSVNYDDANGCSALSSSIYNVTVNPLPVPVVSGPNDVCEASTGNVYTTDIGMTNYSWVVSAGGTITAGGGVNDNTVTVTWNTAGARTVSVNYSNANGCSAAAPTVYNVTVNGLPTPALAGPNDVCEASTGNVYTTDAGMTNYTWVVSAGGTITAGGGINNNTVTVTWNTAGAQTVSVNYDDGNGCGSAVPTNYNVTVNSLPAPNLAGPNSVCEASMGNVYTTDAGMTNYSWTISAGGTITAGGGINDNTVTITWNTAGAQTVNVNYDDANGCAALAPTIYNVTVNALPNPALAGPNDVCEASTGNVYTSDAGMTNYSWVVSAGGTITAGGGVNDNTVTVTWNTAGAQTVSINYDDANGCSAIAPTTYNVTVNALPTPTLAGPNSVCEASTGNVYTTDAGMTNYAWIVSAGGTITAGGGVNDNTVTVTWNTAGAQTVSVNYDDANSCGAAAPTVYNVTVNALPTPALAGPNSVCEGTTGNVYTTDAGMTNYSWAISAGGTVTAGGGVNDNSVTITWNTAGAQTVDVNYNNASACSALTPTTYNVTVNPLPVPTIGGPNSTCETSISNVYTTEAGMTNYSWTISAGGTITAGGGVNDNTVTVTWNTAGAQTVSINYDDVNGCAGATPTQYNVTVNPLPIPTIAGPNNICVASTGNVYTTDAGMTNYSWTISAGGTITAGGGINDNTVTVTWNTAGAQTVSINYDDVNGCAGAIPTTYNVTVNGLPTVIAMNNGPVCEGSSMQLTALALPALSFSWTGPDGFTSTDQSPEVSAAATPAMAGLYRIDVTDGIGCTNFATTNVTVIDAPVVEAGDDATICSGDDLPISGASVTNVASFQWRSSGDGAFDDDLLLNPVYTPGSIDSTSGQVILYLDAIGNAPCLMVTDSLILTLPLPVQPAIGAPAPFLIGNTTEIEVCVETNGRLLVSDLGLYLISPDGTTMDLKRGLQEFNFFAPACLPLPPGDVNFCFTTELTLADTVDYCSQFSGPYTGTHAATGNWSSFYGMNPAEGGWSVMVKDTAANSGGVDGQIVNASIRFIDIATATGQLRTVLFESGPINVDIKEPTNNTIVLPQELSVSCFGECDAEAIVNVIGGTPPYTTYVWSPAPFSSNALGDSVMLCEGTYDVTVTDALGCSGTSSVTVIEPPQLIIDTVLYTDTLMCNAVSDGFINVKASGGTGSLSYILLPLNDTLVAADSGYFNNLPAGDYTIEIWDGSGCFINTSLSIFEPTATQIDTAYISIPLSCSGDTIGEITARASGGTAPYTYILYPDLDTNSTGIFINLTSNDYYVKMFDSYGCDTLTSDTLYMTPPDPLNIDTVQADPITCFGDLAPLTVVSSGGTPLYNVSTILGTDTTTIIGISDTALFDALPGRNYILLEDAAGCWQLDSIDIIQPATPFIFDSINAYDVTGCADSANGLIDVYVSGGWGTNYTYSRDSITFTPSNSFNKLVQGNYTIYVNDSLGCLIQSDVPISGPAPLLANPFVTNAVGDAPGSITFMSSGGTPPYEYWIGTTYIHDTLRSYVTTTLFDSLAPATYFAVVKDANGCFDEVITEVDVDRLEIEAEFACYSNTGPIIQLNILEGIMPFTVYDSNYVSGITHTITFNQNAPFTDYIDVERDSNYVRVRDLSGLYWDSVMYVDYPTIDTVWITPKTCSALGLDSLPTWDGTANIETTGGTGDLFFSLSVYNPTGADIPNYRTADTGYFDDLGQYNWHNVFVTDENGCSDSAVSFVGLGGTFPQMYPRYVQESLLPPDTIVCKYNQLELSAGYIYPYASPTQRYTAEAIWNPSEIFTDYDDDRLEPSATARIMADSTIIHLKLTQTEVANCMLLDSVRVDIYDTVGMAFKLETSPGYGYDSASGQILATQGAQIIMTLPQQYRHTKVDIELEDDEILGDLLDTTLYEPNGPHQHIIFADLDSIYFSMGITDIGCVESDTIRIGVRPAISNDSVFTVFTPNGDGHNDLWTIPYAHLYSDVEVEIFNRWGQIIYRQKGYGANDQMTWDGTSMQNGKYLPVGTYFYIIKPNDGQTDPISGTVTIIR